MWLWWHIELFFKALKQNLKVKTFVGTSENALYIQIWTALITMLLIKYMQFKSKMNWSLSNLVAFLRWNLFTYRDLWEWLDDPYEVPPIASVPVQKPLPFMGFGQHGWKWVTWFSKPAMWPPKEPILLKAIGQFQFILDSSDQKYPTQRILSIRHIFDREIFCKWWDAYQLQIATA